MLTWPRAVWSSLPEETLIYLLCGMKVASDVHLPDLVRWVGDDRAPDVVICVGGVPDRLTSIVYEGPLLSVAAGGACRFGMPGVADYLVEGGSRITVQPHGDAEAPDIRLFLLGTVFGFLIHQRALLPLHAGCVEMGGKAIAFAGASGAGKSTLIAALVQRGFRMLADDLTVVDVDAADGPAVLPSFPRVKLWRDAMERLGFVPDAFDRTRAQLEKYQVPTESEFRKEPLSLSAIYHLSRIRGSGSARFQPLCGMEAVGEHIRAIYRQQAAFHLGRKEAIMRASMALAPIPSFRLARSNDFAHLGEIVDGLIQRHGGPL